MNRKTKTKQTSPSSINTINYQQMVIFQRETMSLTYVILLPAPCFVVWMFVAGTLIPGCPDMCKCEGERIICEGFIPRQVPNNVSEVLLSFNSTLLSSGIFCNVSWDNVIKLSISYIAPWPESFSLDDYVFLCLKQIQILQLYTKNYFNTTRNSLYGLESVTVLDLSGCERLVNRELNNLLSVKTSVANLKKLNLSGMNYLQDGLDLSQDLIDILADTDITELDISNTTVSSTLTSISGICDTLKTTNLSKAYITTLSHFLFGSSCKSLNILDLDGANIHSIHSKFENYHGPIKTHMIFKHLDILYASRLIPTDKIVFISNCSVTGLGESFNFKEVHLNGYNVRKLDIEVVNLVDQLQYFDLSDNRMQTIGPNVFKTLKHLIKIDLSKNKLSQGKMFDKTFSVLFQNNSNLKEISLTDNGLRYLPLATFSSNPHLKRIDISNNKFQQISFDVSRLINLDILDMHNNSVQSLDKSSRGALDLLYEIHRLANHTYPNTTPFLIDLRANPFSCECDSLPFIKWFIRSPMFSTYRHQYHCKVDGSEIKMNDKAVAAAEDDCERPKRKLRKILLSSIIPVTVTAILILVTVYVVKRYRRKKLVQRLEDQVGLLHDDNIGFRFPVFVSYSSDDIAFVIPNVINPLRENLQRIAGTDRELVCVGDRYFRPGRTIFSEIITCLEDCAVVVVVMSLNYCRSEYCKLEIEQSRLMCKPIIIIVKEEVDEDEMNAVTKEIFRHFTRIGFNMEEGQVSLQRDWEDVCLSIIQLL